MKKHHSMVWSLCALAVVASPLTLDHVWTHMHHSYISRSIASDPVPAESAPADAQVADAAPADAAPADAQVADAAPADSDPAAEEPNNTQIVLDSAPRPVFGPVNETVAPRDMAAFNRFVSANQVAVNSVTSPFSVTTGESASDSFRRHEEATITLLQELRTTKDSIAQLLQNATRDSSSAQVRDQLIGQVGRLLRLEQDFNGINDLEAARTQAAGQLDLSASTLPAVKSFADEVLASLEQLDTRITELRAAPVEPRAVASTTTTTEPELTADQRRRLERADQILADQERREREDRERECRDSKTSPAAAPQIEQMNNMLMAMIMQNQSMISLMMMRMMQNMSGPYFSQGSWPNQSYANTGLNLNYGQFLPGQVNPYSQYADQLNGINQLGVQAPLIGMPGAQTAQLPLSNAFDFGSGLPTAQFGNFQPFTGPQLPAIASI